MVCIQINDQDYVMTREAGDSNHGAMQEDMQVDMDEEISSNRFSIRRWIRISDIRRLGDGVDQ